MGQLAIYLQEAFQAQSPDGWSCRREKHVLSEPFESLLGYSPRADVCLEHHSNARRIWIEFEISRADPVANHAKFATAHLFKPFSPADTFVSMVNSHVARGRRNLASSTIQLLRHVGISAFQTVLLPSTQPDEIKRLNHASIESLRASNLDTHKELERVFQVVEPVIENQGHRIHLASELFDVIRNLLGWNDEVLEPTGAALWKRRRVTYFVFDPVSELFAPSKFCAYTIPTRIGPAHDGPAQSTPVGSGPDSGLMNIASYCALDESDRRFDGNRARMHLASGLGMILQSANQAPEIHLAFHSWMTKHSSAILVHPSGPQFLVPPAWYR